MKWGCIQESDVKKHSDPVIVHVVERHLPDSDHAKIARASWQELYATGRVRPVHCWHWPRSARDFGDSRDLPFLRDLLRMALNESNGNDIVCLTNGDTILHPETPRILTRQLERYPVACSFRLNVESPPKPGQPQQWSKLGRSDFGRDLFAFRVMWLEAYLDSLPDFLLGELEWDLMLASLCRLENGVRLGPKRDLGVWMPKSEIPFGYVLHICHDRVWTWKQFDDAPGKIHNKKAANAWYLANGLPSYTIK